MPFARILRSSALMGGAQVVVLAAGFIRAKAIAVILGASGVGLIGIFNAFSGNVSSFAGWGLGTSGVRLIAGAPEEEKPAKVAAVRRMGWTLSLLGLALALILFWPVGSVTFASTQYAVEMAIVALAVPCVIASSAWSAVLQASGKIASLAKVQVAGALTGLLLGLPAIWLWGTIGIAVSIFLAAAVPAIVLWRAARAACPLVIGATVVQADLKKLVKLGGAFMIIGWLGQFSGYAVRLVIVRHEGLEAAGYYQAAFAISGSLPGFIFAAMGADFFPRVAAAKDDIEAIGIVEKQVQAGLILGVPLIALLLLFGKTAIWLLYANGLDPAALLLPWMVWAVFIRILSWPLGFWLIAKGEPGLVIIVETFACAVLVSASWILLDGFGVEGVAIASFASGVLYLCALIFIAYKKAGKSFGFQTWSGVLVATFLLLIGQVLALIHAHPAILAAYGFTLVGLSTWACFKSISLQSAKKHGQ